MKKTYCPPTLDIVKLDTTDIIATSMQVYNEEADFTEYNL